MTCPRLHWGWSSYVGSDFSTSQHWLGVRDHLSENFKNELLWLITLKGVKVRDSIPGVISTLNLVQYVIIRKLLIIAF